MRSGPVLSDLAAEVAEAATPAGRLLRLTALRQAVDAAMVAELGELEAAPGPVLLDGAVDASPSTAPTAPPLSRWANEPPDEWLSS